MERPPDSPSLRPSLRLAGATLLGETAAAAIAQFDVPENRRVLRAGELLFAQGDPPDALYIVMHGSLEVLRRDTRGDHVLAVIVRGGLVGEMALLTDEPRYATVRAVRATQLLRVSKQAFDGLLETHPSVGMQMARMLVGRLRSDARIRIRRPSTIGLLPLAGRQVNDEFARALLQALRGHDDPSGKPVIRLDAEDVNRAMGAPFADIPLQPAEEERLLAWLAETEDGRARVLIDCDAVGTAWNARALQQADLVLVVADASEPPELLAPALEAAERAGSRARFELVLLQDPDVRVPSGTRHWLAQGRFAAHHHVRFPRHGRPDAERVRADVERLARAVVGRTHGVVLGGGGARAFAHIGVLRAVKEYGFPVDIIGGASMGAIIAAMHAADFTLEEMKAQCLRHYVREAQVPDRTVPVVALSSGRNAVRKLRAMFGDREIEDLWTRYFCVSCNLSRACTVVHGSGPIWRWTRASCAIPGLAPPVVVNGELHADGGILDNMPIEAMREHCDGSILASDVSVPVELQTDSVQREVVRGMSAVAERWRMAPGQRPFPSIIEILGRTAMAASVRDAADAERLATIFVRPNLDDIGMADFKKIDRLIDIGYEHASGLLAAWKLSGGVLSGR